jgi:hypothetical protein
MDEINFLNLSIRARRFWDHDDAKKISGYQIPDGILGPRRKTLLRADIAILWSSWFIESLLDPQRYVLEGKNYLHLFADAFHLVSENFSHLTKDERRDFAQVIANELWGRVEILRRNSSRTSIDRNTRFDLLADAGTNPRCWICGHLFSDPAIKAFEDIKPTNSLPFEFVDVYKPLGLSSVDSTIQIDHVEAWSKGGRDLNNLKLCCAWCNRNKSSHGSIYDVAGTANTANANKYEIFSLPQRFWIVRLIAAVRRCEHSEGCDATTENSELTVEPINPLGMATPNNLRVVCGDHHYLQQNRLMPRRVVLDIWRINQE